MAAVWRLLRLWGWQYPHKTLPQEGEAVTTFLRASSGDKTYRRQAKIHLDQDQKHILTFPDKGTAM